jgi:uncharacterized protein
MNSDGARTANHRIDIMNSRIYKGWVRHRRYAPTGHRFRYRLFMLYLDLAELPQIFDGTPFWSARRRAPAWFKRSDYLGPAAVPLDTAVRDLVQERTGNRPTGAIRLLTHLRYFGYCMNPVSFYYCFSPSDQRVETIVADITNTPWKERHQYVLNRPSVRASCPGGASNHESVERHERRTDADQIPTADTRLPRFEFDKEFHVSPFLPMNMRYGWDFSEPADRLFVHMQNFSGGERLFDATLALHQEPISRGALLRALVAYPLMTLKVIAAIHWQALKLWLKRTPYHSHPLAASRPATSHTRPSNP